MDSFAELRRVPDAASAASGGRALQHRAEALKRWLFDAALPLWSSVGLDRDRGAFEESLSQDATPIGAGRRVRVQARQAYSFATAGMLGWEGAWREPAWLGLQALMQGYRRPDGLYRALVSPSGAVEDDTARLYDQAFVLLALGRVAAAEGDPAPLEKEALNLLKALGDFRHAAGGFRERSDRPFQANAQMHLLEACMEWMDQSPRGPWADIAEEIVELCLVRFIDPRNGQLLEVFDEAWRPAAGALGTIAEPGHQFEWSWLLRRWSDRTGDSSARIAAEQLYQAGLAGLDESRGVAVDELSVADWSRSQTARLWPQTEWLKAAIHDGETNGRWRPAVAAADAVFRYLQTPKPGLWWDRLLEDGQMRCEPAPASSLYHIITACAELARVSADLALDAALRPPAAEPFAGAAEA